MITVRNALKVQIGSESEQIIGQCSLVTSRNYEHNKTRTVNIKFIPQLIGHKTNDINFVSKVYSLIWQVINV